MEKIIVFELKYRTKYQKPLADQHQEQLTTFIVEIAKALPVNSHNLPKSQFERQFAKELCKLSYLFNLPPDISGFLEGQARQVAENINAQPRFFTRDQLKDIFSKGEFLYCYGTSKFALLNGSSQLEEPSATQLVRSKSCHL